MKVSELKEGLGKVVAHFNAENVNIRFTKEMIHDIHAMLRDDFPDREDRCKIVTAFVGFAVGRELGFEQGKNFIFDYNPPCEYE